jgi:replicative DNA helicase
MQPAEPLEDAEVLLINALLETSAFEPVKYGIREEMFTTWHKLFLFCCDYQTKARRPPSDELVSRSFPTFELLAEVDAGWAADMLRMQYSEAELRRQIGSAAMLLKDGAYDEARKLIADAAKPSDYLRPNGLMIMDPTVLEDSPIKAGFCCPWPTMQKATGGIGWGETLTIGARFSVGKSWLAPEFAVSAAQTAPVAVMSCEMTKRNYIRRIHQVLAQGDPALQRDLRSPDRAIRFAAFDKVKPPPHPIQVLDPSDAKMSLRTMEGLAVDHRTIIIDHVGLLSNHTGKRAIEDWRVAAEISNVIKELNLAADIAIILLSQINRQGDSTHSWKPPKASTLQGTDALGQDADMVVTCARPSEGTMAYHLGKNRNSYEARWYSKFLPATADFSEISKDDMLDLRSADQDRTGDA